MGEKERAAKERGKENEAAENPLDDTKMWDRPPDDQPDVCGPFGLDFFLRANKCFWQKQFHAMLVATRYLDVEENKAKRRRECLEAISGIETMYNVVTNQSRYLSQEQGMSFDAAKVEDPL